jgi:predicted transcriptional regulator
MPKTLTIELPDEIYEGLQKLAEKWKTTPERIAADWVVLQADQVLNDPLEEIIGAIDTGVIGWGERHDELLGEALMKKVRGEPDDA